MFIRGEIMTTAAKEIVKMLEMLPLEEQEFACEVMRKLIRAWDPDFSKLTPKEAAELQLAHEEAARGEVFWHDEIDWDNLDEMNLN